MGELEYKKIVVKDYTEEELRELWRKEYCRKIINTHDGIRVKFYDSHFNHAFYESSSRKQSKNNKDTLSSVRLSRILWIKDVLVDKDAEMYVGYENRTKRYNKNKRVSVVKGNYVVVIELQKNGTATFITAFVADNSIEKVISGHKWNEYKG